MKSTINKSKKKKIERSLDVVSFTQQCIAIPSYVQGTVNEVKFTNFIETILIEKEWPYRKQAFDGIRSNLLIGNWVNPKRIFLGHTDTVPAGSQWSKGPFSGIIQNNRIYGLGSTDMKSGIAALLSAVSTTGLPDDVLIVLYGDEEYSFKGMKKVISAANRWNPDLLISLDGKKEEIGYAGRGLIEVSFTLTGKTAHASRPEKGINSIESAVEIVKQLRNDISSYGSVELGLTTVNTAGLVGGMRAKDGSIFCQPNAVADTADIVLDIRPASVNVRSELIKDVLESYADRLGCNISQWSVRYDYGSWQSETTTITNQLPTLPKDWKFSVCSGYIDMQLLWEKLDCPTACTIGAGDMTRAHAPDEYVEIDALENLTKALVHILTS